MKKNKNKKDLAGISINFDRNQATLKFQSEGARIPGALKEIFGVTS